MSAELCEVEGVIRLYDGKVLFPYGELRINKDLPGFLRIFMVYFVFSLEQPDNTQIMAINCKLKTQHH